MCGLRLIGELCRPGQVEVRWVADNSGMRVQGSKQEKLERKTKEDVGVGSKQSTDKQNMDEVEKKTMDKVEAKAKELELEREDL